MTKNCTFAIITKKLCFIQSKPANYRHLIIIIFTNQKIEIFSFVTLPSPNTKKKHPKWDLGKDLSSQAFIER